MEIPKRVDGTAADFRVTRNLDTQVVYLQFELTGELDPTSQKWTDWIPMSEPLLSRAIASLQLQVQALTLARRGLLEDEKH